jgi:UDP-glucuronate 4-epimerase
MKSYLVAGAAGFIGARTSELLLNRGDRVVGIDNLNDYYDVRMKEKRLGLLNSHSAFSFEQVDIENSDAVSNLFSRNRFDAVFNLAARAGVEYSLENPQVYMKTNTLGTLNLLEAMKEKSVRKFVLASTSSLYAGEKIPFTETLPVNTPRNPYSASKKAAEMVAYSYHHLYEIDVSVVRYFTVFGPAGRPDMSIFRFVQWIRNGEPVMVYGDGFQTRDFTFIDDIAEGTIAALAPTGYEIVNLGGGKSPVSLNTIIERIEKQLGKTAKCVHEPFRKGDIVETRADISKARRLWDWQPKTPMLDGLARTVEWHESQRKFLDSIRL